MSHAANVLSIQAVESLRLALQCFETDASAALGALALEVQRLVDWLEHDRLSYWKQQVRRNSNRLAEARISLERCRLQSVSGERPSCQEERNALDQARRRLRISEEKIEAVRHWSRVVGKEVTEYTARVGQLAGWLECDSPKALAVLEQMIAALESYVSIEPPPPAPPAEREHGSAAEGKSRPATNSTTLNST